MEIACPCFLCGSIFNLLDTLQVVNLWLLFIVICDNVDPNQDVDFPVKW